MKNVVLDSSLSSQVTQEAIEKGEKGLKNPKGQEALAAARKVAASLFDFTTDDVWQELGWVPDTHNEASFMGSVMRHLSVGKEITWTGSHRVSKRPEQHRKPLKVWTKGPSLII